MAAMLSIAKSVSQYANCRQPQTVLPHHLQPSLYASPDY